MYFDIAYSILEISLGTSIVIFVLLLLSPWVDKKYAAKWKCFIWLILALRLIVPINTNFLKEYVSFTVPEVNIHHEVQLVDVQTMDNLKVKSDTFLDNTEVSSYDRSMISKEFLFLTCLVGMLLFMSYQFLANCSFRKQVLRWSRPVNNKKIVEQLQEVLDQMQIKRTIRVFVSEKISSPMMIGLFKPILLFPCESYSESELHFIIKHELIHYKRHDIWFKLLLLIVNGIHWFNPLVYVMRQKASKDIELCCDEEVVKGYSFEYRKAYSDTIIASISLQHRHRTALSTYFNQGAKTMKERLKGVLDMRIKRKGIITLGVMIICILVVSGSVVLNRTKQSEAEDMYKGTEKDAESIDAITNAVLSNDIAFIEKVIEEGNIDLNTKNSEGEYPLAITLIMENCDMAKLLLEAGADPYKDLSDGKTIYDVVMKSDSKYYKSIFKAYQKE